MKLYKPESHIIPKLIKAKNLDAYNSFIGAYLESGSQGLDFSNAELSDTDLNKITVDLKASLANPENSGFIIQAIDLTGNRLQLNTTPDFIELLKTNQITDLRLGFNQINDDGMVALSPALKNMSLKTLYLDNNKFTATGLKTVLDSLPSETLTNLSLSLNDIGPDMGDLLTDFLKVHPQLMSADISDNKIGSESLLPFIKNLGQSKLENLNVSGNILDSDFAKQLATVLSQTKLKVLNLSYNVIGGEGLQAISQQLPHTDIRNFSIGNTKPTEDNIISLAKQLPYCKITSLSLNENHPMSSAAIKAISDNLSGSNLTYLNLNYCAPPYAELSTFHAAMKKSSLEKCELLSSKVTKDMMAAINETGRKNKQKNKIKLAKEMGKEMGRHSCVVKDLLSIIGGYLFEDEPKSNRISISPLKQSDLQNALVKGYEKAQKELSPYTQGSSISAPIQQLTNAV